MRHTDRRTRRILAMLTLSLLLTANAAIWAADVPRPSRVILIYETNEGRTRHVLDGYGLKYFGRTAGQRERMRDLQELLQRGEVLSPFLLAVACPKAKSIERCEQLRVAADTELRQALAHASVPSVIVIRAEVGISKQAQVYDAHFRVDLLGGGWRAPFKSFAVEYRDWRCGEYCVRNAYGASVREVVAMINYMLDLEFGGRAANVPPAWKALPRPQEVPGWANDCFRLVHDDRVVRDGEGRVWLGAKGRFGPSLVSLAKHGCNALTEHQSAASE